MTNLLITIRKFMLRLALGLIALALIAASAFTAYIFFGLFDHTSYKFVALFLLVILLSNLLAKIARTYIDA